MISLNNLTAGGLNWSAGGTSATFVVTPQSQGTCSVSVAADEFQDYAGNNNTASTPLSYTYDVSHAQVLNITSASTMGYFNGKPVITNDVSSGAINFEITLSDNLTSDFKDLFVEGDISGGSGTISNFDVCMNIATGLFTPGSQGEHTLTVAAGTFADEAGNLNENSASYTYFYDAIVPAFTVLSTSVDASSNHFNTSTVTIDLSFNEEIYSIDNNKITCPNASIGVSMNDDKMGANTITLTPNHGSLEYTLIFSRTLFRITLDYLALTLIQKILLRYSFTYCEYFS